MVDPYCAALRRIMGMAPDFGWFESQSYVARERVKRHLRTCAGCRDALDARGEELCASIGKRYQA